jgi:LysM repeat protein
MKKLVAAALLLVTLAACSQKPRPEAAPIASATVTDAEIEAVQATLLRGDRKAATKQVNALIKRAPMDPSLLLLKQSITGDAAADLGPTNYPYAVKPGDTIEGLAARLLGNRLKAYQLARYNGLEAPVTLAPGQTLRIPGAMPVAPKPKPAVSERPARTTAPAPAPAAARPKPPAAASTRPAPAPAANPAAARQARAAGLTALNQGNVTRAVALLRRANALDPGNALIQRDLQRAERIANTVRARN